MQSLLKRLRKASDDLYIFRKTRSDIRSAEARLSAIHSAWNDAGPVPDYHEHMKNKLRRDWPTLAGALDEATK
jgi:hypothetical protein